MNIIICTLTNYMLCLSLVIVIKTFYLSPCWHLALSGLYNHFSPTGCKVNMFAMLIHDLEEVYVCICVGFVSERTRCGVWILDGDPYHTGLLRFALTKESFPNSLVVLVVSMEQPWAIMEQLRKWSTILQDHIERLRIPHSQMASFEEHCEYTLRHPLLSIGIAQQNCESP